MARFSIIAILTPLFGAVSAVFALRRRPLAVLIGGALLGLCFGLCVHWIPVGIAKLADSAASDKIKVVIGIPMVLLALISPLSALGSYWTAKRFFKQTA